MESCLQTFFDTVTWYGSPFVKNYLTDHKGDLLSQCHKDIWNQKSLGFKKDAHLSILQNDYQYLLAYIIYRFADLGVYEFVKELYEDSIADIPEARAMLKIWELTEVKHRECFTNYGVSCWILSEDDKRELKDIYDKYPDNTSGFVAKCLLHESYINEQEMLGRSSDEAAKDLGYDNAFEFYLILNGVNSVNAYKDDESNLMCSKDVVDDVTRAWNELDAEFIIKHLSPDFRYDSQWVFNYMLYDEYVRYLKKKFHTIKNNNSIIKAETIRDTEQGGWMTKIVQISGQNENICFYRIKIKDSLIIKGDLCGF